MSDRFFYLQLKFIPKIGHTFAEERQLLVEVSKDLVQRNLTNENLREVVALDLARKAALCTFPTLSERIIGVYDEGSPTWHSHRPLIVSKRPCDHEENGTRAVEDRLEDPAALQGTEEERGAPRPFSAGPR